MTITTRPMVSARVNCTSLTESRMFCDRSDTSSTWIDGGNDACSSGICALTWSTTSSVLAPAWRRISSSSAGLPLNQAPVRGDLEESIDLADVLHPHRRAVAVGDDHVVERRRH